MEDASYFSHLYEIARHLNQAYSVQAALRLALEHTVRLLELETGWIWLLQPDKRSVYLAASHQLPPALSKHPERLSGWCWCIERYLSDAFQEARNISEITCSRLKDVSKDTHDLKFHATVPILVNGEKAGLLNLLSKDKQQLDEKKLSILNTISELMGMAIQRTRLQDAHGEKANESGRQLGNLLERVIAPRLDVLTETLEEIDRGNSSVAEAMKQVGEIKGQMGLIKSEIRKEDGPDVSSNTFHYPTSPLTKRELEVLQAVRSGGTNKQIAEQLHISERTVKFHISSIFSKLHAETRTEAVDTALRRGLLGG